MAENRWPRAVLETHSVDLRQFIDFRQSTLADGMRMVDAYNSSGLHFTIVPDRGLDLWAAYYNGLPLTWISAGSPHRPDFGLTFAQQFDGGLMFTCGLQHVGQPETDPISGEYRDLHGRYSRLPAQDINVSGAWQGDGRYLLALSATVYEETFFGAQLRLQRTYSLVLGEPVIHIEDAVTNFGDIPAPLLLLYHFNFGYPVVQAGTQLTVAVEKTYPYNGTAQAGLDRWPHYDGPIAGYPEQVFFHHIRTLPEENIGQAAFGTDTLAVLLRWDAAALPYLTQWKNIREGLYINGIEPGNCIPEGQSSARASGRLQTLAPGERRTAWCDLRVLEGTGAVRAAREEIARVASVGTAVAGCNLTNWELR